MNENHILVGKFIRDFKQYENLPGYVDRLQRELALIDLHKLTPMFVQVQDIIKLIPDIPHNIRGSAGSSLVCFLLGISHIDPIAWGIGLTRFIHELRKDMPDIDIDVPWNLRDDVWTRVFSRYGDRALRVSNKIGWKTKSIKQEFLRRQKRDPSVLYEQVEDELLGAQRAWSVHCGGVVIFDASVNDGKGAPDDIVLRPYQLNLDKNDVEARGLYKIDILSSRALGQLAEISSRPLFDYPAEDSRTEALWTGDVAHCASAPGVGVTGGESPAFRKAVMGIEAKTRQDIMLASALIRPAAASGLKKAECLEQYRKNRTMDNLVYDDDCIRVISERLRVSEAEADLIRRKIVKGKIEVPDNLKDVAEFTAYSFCKSHAIAYGAVVWALSYWKARDPQKFWTSALNNCMSMYRKWVHVREAIRCGVPSHHIDPQLSLFRPSGSDQARVKGFWTGDELPGMVDEKRDDAFKFKGLIAASRVYKPKEHQPMTFVTIWTGQYRQLVLKGMVDVSKSVWIEGLGKYEVVQNADHIAVRDFRLTDCW